jgi:hypothetical protein
MGERHQNNRGRWPLLIPLLALVYAPFIGGDLLTDDFVHFQRLTSRGSIADLVSQPDAFRFYRPVTQASLAIELTLHGDRPAFFRAVNVGLHAAVLAMALVVARLILRDEISAALATLAFALTPKAPAIAVLWISGRAELLMALFAFASVAAWIAWVRHGGAHWLLATAVAYLAAAGSKETAFVLPLLLIFIPAERPRTTARFGAIAALLALGAALLVWRAHVGALTPMSGDDHYTLLTGLARVLRSVRNYVGRLLPAPIALITMIAIVRMLDARRRSAPARAQPILVTHFVLPLAWMLLFLLPVLPIVARSEIYVYLPAFGMCLVAAVIARALLLDVSRRGAALATIGVFVLTLAGYQVWRAASMHRDLQFSAILLDAFRADADLANRRGAITLVPADADTERLLQDSIGGYLYSVLHRAFPDGHLTGVTEYAGMHVTGTSARIRAEYRDGRVLLMHESEPR